MPDTSAKIIDIARRNGHAAQSDTAKAYLNMQEDVSKLPEEMRNYIFLNVGEYANYLLRLYSKKNWQELLASLTAERHESLKDSVASLLESIKEIEAGNQETAFCGIALRIVLYNLDLAKSALPENAEVEKAITEIIDRWVKVYNQMIYKGIGNG